MVFIKRFLYVLDNFKNLHFNPFYNESFSDAEDKRDPDEFFLMESIHTTSNVLIFSQMKWKVLFLRKKILKLLMQSM